jgi:hypothetical protein
VWATGDGAPSSGSWGFDRHLVEVPEDAAAGEYEVVVGLYDAQSGDRVPPKGEDAAIDAAARSVRVGTLTVR